MNRFVFGLRFTLFGLLLSINYSSSKSVDCHTNLTSIAFAEYDVKDLSVHRTYILCPNTTFDAASLNSDFSFTEKHALFIRSNALVLCGQDGSSDNSCVINGNGDYGIVIDPLLWGYNESFVENVTIQGVTVDYFSGNEEYSVFPVSIGLESGDVTFKDCIFSNNFNVPLFDIAQYIVPSKRLLREGDTETVERELQSNVKITFDSCKFDGNQGSEEPRTSGGVSLLSFSGRDPSTFKQLQGTLDVDLVNNQFSNNDYSFENDGTLFRSLIDFYSTGKLRMKNNCFIESSLFALTNSSIVMTTEESVVVVDNNYRDDTLADLECPDVYQYLVEIDDYVCQTSLTFDATECPVTSSSTTTSTPASLPASSSPTTTSTSASSPTTTTTTAPTSVTTDTAVPATTPTTVPSPTTSSPPSGATTIPMWTVENLFMSILFAIFVMEMF